MQYEALGQIGAGRYGDVFKARVVGTETFVAIKRTRIADLAEGIPQTSIREIAALRKVQHPNVVRLLDVAATRQHVSLVFGFVDMDLAQYARSVGGAIQPKIIKSLSQQLALGIEFCHRNGIMHRDLKPQNLLVDSNLQLKIADFGIARMYLVPVPAYTAKVVTLWYRAPELLLGGTLYGPPRHVERRLCHRGDGDSGISASVRWHVRDRNDFHDLQEAGHPYCGGVASVGRPAGLLGALPQVEGNGLGRLAKQHGR